LHTTYLRKVFFSQRKKTGNELKLKSVTVLQRGETQLPDYYSMLLIQSETRLAATSST